MRSILVCALLISAVSAAGVQASESTGRVALDSPEGQAIVKGVVGISQRVGLPNPLVAPQPEAALTGREALLARKGTIFRAPEAASDNWRANTPLDGRYAAKYSSRLAAGAKEKLLAERAELLSRLDLDAETRARIGLN